MSELTVMTVLGPVPVSELGPVLPHEHVFIDLSCYVHELGSFTELPIRDEPVSLANLKGVRNNPYGNMDNCVLDDADLMVGECKEFKDAGGGTLVDATNADLGP